MKSVCALLALVSAVAAGPALEPRQQRPTNSRTPPITVRGNAFFQGNQRFYIRGIDYQPGGSSEAADPLSDTKICQRDIDEFKLLGINTVRIYTIDNSKNHDQCMRMLSDAGIYLALDVNTPKYSINRADPAPSYNDVYLQSVFATVDAFAKYDNTLLFFSANEVINDEQTAGTAPYIKAVTRDIRAYIKARGYRQIPVGYSAADVESNRVQTAQYMNCGEEEVRSDFFAFNDYSWCDPSDFIKAGWDKKVETFSDYSIPLFLSEYGCITNKREFNEVEALYSDQMTSVYSGGLVYEYTEEDSGYGLADVRNGRTVNKPDFDVLRNKFREVPAPRDDGGFKENGTPSECPQRGPGWDFDQTVVPAIPIPAEKYMSNGAGRGPGLAGVGSQTAGTPSTTTVDVGSSEGEGGDSASTSSSAAVPMQIPAFSMASVLCSAVVVFSMLMGAAVF